jgi:murein DD-endopeptidase MepM/ murein hydrolase activator NlpD
MLFALLVALAATAPDPAARARDLLAKEASILDAIDALDHAIVDIATQQQAAKDRLAELEHDQARLEQRLAGLEAQAAERRSKVRARLEARSSLESGADLRLVLGARDLGDLIRWRYALGRIVRHDVDLLRAVRADEAAIAAATREKLRNAADVAAAQAQLAERRDRLEDERRTRNEVLARIRNERGLQERLAAEKEKRDAALTAALPGGPNGEPDDLARQRGHLPMPVPGRVVRGFGRRADPELGTVTLSKGLDIDAPLGAPVRAVYSGEVVYAGWYKGFGNVVIVRHPGDWYTLSAHLSAVDKARGEHVAQGDVIGEVGDTGSLSGPMLYFELRRRSEAVDPMPWLRNGP